MDQAPTPSELLGIIAQKFRSRAELLHWKDSIEDAIRTDGLQLPERTRWKLTVEAALRKLEQEIDTLFQTIPRFE